AGDWHTIARCSDGSIRGFGDNPFGQCDAPAALGAFACVEVAAGGDNSLARYVPACVTPTVYCTAKVNSLGCSPEIGFIGTPSATANSGFVLSATSELNNSVGL